MPAQKDPKKSAARDASGMKDPTAAEQKDRTREDQEREMQANVDIIRRSGASR